MVQDIGLSRETEKIEVTLSVMRLFSVSPGESRDCVRCVRTTAESRLNAATTLNVYWNCDDGGDARFLPN